MITFNKRKNIRYIKLVPDKMESGKKYPLIIHIHGAGGRGDDLSLISDATILKKLDGDERFIVVAPQCYANTWFDIFEQLKEFIKFAVSCPDVDAKRVYLSGVSMGGYTSWQLLMSEPETFAASIVCCGGGMYWNAPRVKTPAWAFHGKLDKTVYAIESENMVKAINASGGSAKLTIYDELEHNCWDVTYFNDQIYEWLLSHKKQ